ncbi:hypothetical protein MCAG_03807 [Micromonospora sp. ATCC 39149]|uniref:hypothetical protein n=1 Tax=Micromonospora sp. (strain ATCC 39149 / NRRL 15099 / SCC 1413) TaxID=219305 RepID=UPI0001A504BA|nr:hypothetical protein [Micromonospora sp. ATCC 39149]EEP73480.1 hypothetical protein MCAG_03807 [Micromonospora sp. ATCC 39149]
MVERPHDAPCPGAHSVAHGRPPLPDGHVVPHLPRPAPPPGLTRRQYAAGWVCAGLVLVLLAAGILGTL